MIFINFTSIFEQSNVQFFPKNKRITLDENLIKQIANGDSRAFSELYNQTYWIVYGFALSIIKNKHTCEDITQEVFIKIYNNSDTYIPKGKPMAWILTITRNLCLMALRKTGREAENCKEIIEDYQVNSNLSALSDLSNNSDNKILIDFLLKSLNSTERQIVTLFAISGLKHREIAGILQISLSSTLSKYNRALKKMRNFLGDDIYEK